MLHQEFKVCQYCPQLHCHLLKAIERGYWTYGHCLSLRCVTALNSFAETMLIIYEDQS